MFKSTTLPPSLHWLPFRHRVVSAWTCVLSKSKMKALLFTLIWAFQFFMAVPEDEMIVGSGTIQRPKVRSEQGKGPQLPLIVRTYGSH